MDKEIQTDAFITSVDPRSAEDQKLADIAVKLVQAKAKLSEIKPIVNTLLIRQNKYEKVIVELEEQMEEIRNGQLAFDDVF